MRSESPKERPSPIVYSQDKQTGLNRGGNTHWFTLNKHE